MALWSSFPGWIQEAGMGHNELHSPSPPIPTAFDFGVHELHSCTSSASMYITTGGKLLFVDEKAMTRRRKETCIASCPGGRSFPSNKVCERKLRHSVPHLLGPVLFPQMPPESARPPEAPSSPAHLGPQVSNPRLEPASWRLLGAAGWLTR